MTRSSARLVGAWPKPRTASCAVLLVTTAMARYCNAFDLVRPDDGADRLAELERRASGIGADIVQRAHFHRAHDAGIVEGDLDVEQPLRPVRVAAAHVFQPVLDQPHREAEPARQIAGDHRVLDAALDAVAAADVDVVMHAHRGGRDFQRQADLVGDISASGSRPSTSSISRQGSQLASTPKVSIGTVEERAPFHPQRQFAWGSGEILVHLAPHEGPVEQHVGAVRFVHQQAPGAIACSASSTKGSCS